MSLTSSKAGIGIHPSSEGRQYEYQSFQVENKEVQSSTSFKTHLSKAFTFTNEQRPYSIPNIPYNIEQLHTQSDNKLDSIEMRWQNRYKTLEESSREEIYKLEKQFKKDSEESENLYRIRLKQIEDAWASEKVQVYLECERRVEQVSDKQELNLQFIRSRQDLEQQSLEYQNQIQRYQSSEREANLQINQLQDEDEKKVLQLSELEHSCSQLQTDNARLNQLIQQMVVELQIVNDKKEDLRLIDEFQLNEKDLELSRSKKLVTEQDAKIKILEKQAINFQYDSQKEINKLRQTVKDQKYEMDQMNNKLTLFEQKKSKDENSLTVLVVDHENELNSWRNRYMTMEGENGRLTAQIKILLGEMDESWKRFEDIDQDRTGRLQKELINTKQQFEILTKNYSRIQKERTQQDTRLSNQFNQQQDIATLKLEYDSTVSKMQEEIKNLNQQKTQLQVQQQKDAQTKLNSQTANEETIQKMNQTNEQSKQAYKEIEKFKQLLLQQKELNETQEKTMKQSKDESLRFSQQLSNKDDKQTQLNDKLKQNEQILEKIKKENQQLQDKIERVQQKDVELVDKLQDQDKLDQNRSAQFEIKLNEVFNLVHTLEKQLSQVQAERDKLYSELHVFQLEAPQQSQQFLDQKRELLLQTQKNIQLNDDHYKLKEQLQKIEGERSSFRELQILGEKQIVKIKQDQDQRMSEFEFQSKFLKDSLQQNHQLEIAQNKIQISSLGDRLQWKDKEIMELLEQIQQLQKQHRDKQNQVLQLDSELDRERLQSKKVQTQLLFTEEEMISLALRLEHATSEVKEMSSDIPDQSVIDELQKIKFQYVQQQNEFSQLKERYENHKQQYQLQSLQQIQVKEVEIQDLKKEIQDQKNNQQYSSSQGSKQEKEIEKLKKDLNRITLQSEDQVRQSFGKDQSDKNSHLNEMSKLENKLLDLTSQNKLIKIQLDKATSDSNKYQTKITELEGDIEILIEDSQSQHQAQLQSNKTITQLQNENQSNQRLQEKQQESSNQINQLKKDLNLVQNDNLQLDSALKQKEDDINRISYELKQLKNENKSLQDQMNKMKKYESIIKELEYSLGEQNKKEDDLNYKIQDLTQNLELSERQSYQSSTSKKLSDTRVIQLERDLQQAREKENLRSSIGSNQNSGMLEKIKQLELANVEYEEEIIILIERVKLQDQEIKGLLVKINQMNKQNNDYQLEMSFMKDIINDSNQKNKGLGDSQSDELAEAKRRIIELENKCALLALDNSSKKKVLEVIRKNQNQSDTPVLRKETEDWRNKAEQSETDYIKQKQTDTRFWRDDNSQILSASTRQQLGIANLAISSIHGPT